MECPHLEECVKITAPSTFAESPLSRWSCEVCETEQSLWLCLTCGVIRCGRYVNGHAKVHAESFINATVTEGLAGGLPEDGDCMDLGDVKPVESALEEESAGCDDSDLATCEVATSENSNLASSSDSVSCTQQNVHEEHTVELTTFQEETAVLDQPSSVEVPEQVSSEKDTDQSRDGDVIADCLAGSLHSEDVVDSGSAQAAEQLTDSVPVQSVEQDISSVGTHCTVTAGQSGEQTVAKENHDEEHGDSVLTDKVEHLHCVCMDCESLAAYCYTCDEFVVNDTNCKQLDQVRKKLQQLASLHKSQDLAVENCENSRRRNLSGNSSKENHVNTRRRKAAGSSENSSRGCAGKRLKTEVKVKPKRAGLRNLGNTCFMNAVLQSLSNIQSFCGYIKELPSLEHKLAKKKLHQTRNCTEGDTVFLVEELRKTLVALWQGDKAAISPESLFSVIWKVVPRFRGYQQQDAHEFMRYLLDRLHTELLAVLPYPNNKSLYIGPKGKSTIVSAIFGGILQNEVNCLICGVESKKHDPFLDLSLDIPTQFVKVSKPKEGDPPLPKCHLADCLSSFTEVEELEESELYYCNNCKKKQRSTKRFWVRRLPNVLCLHLKRFRWQYNMRVKVDTFVEFPVNGLDMNKYLLNNMHETRNSFYGSNEYDLAAVIVHHGSGAGAGHYTSYAIFEVLAKVKKSLCLANFTCWLAAICTQLARDDSWISRRRRLDVREMSCAIRVAGTTSMIAPYLHVNKRLY